MRNQITDMFEKPRLLAIQGSSSPSSSSGTRMWWASSSALCEGPAGIYNVAGDGALTIDEIAQMLGKPTRRLPRGYCGALSF